MTARGYIAALPALLKRHIQREVYESYIAEAARLTLENVAKLGGGSYLQARYPDLVDPKPEDRRTEEEIIAQVKRAWEVDT